MEIELKEVTGDVSNSLQDEGDEKQLCDNCKKIDYDKETVAERFCIKCEEKLCLLCSQEHEKKEEHLVVVLHQQKETKKFKESNFCIDHGEELADFYCAYCKKVICSECLKESHSSHNCSRVEDVADLVSKQAEAEYDNLFDIQCHFDKEREKLFNEKMNVIRTVKEMEKEIRQRCDEITKFVYSETEKLQSELDVFKKERMEEIEMEIRKMEENAFTFEKFKEYYDQIKSNTNPRCTCEAEGVLRNIVDDLKTRPEGRWKSGLYSVELSIQKTDIEQVLPSLGKLTIKCQYKMNQFGAVQLDEKQVFGMAKLHDKLYVLSKSISIRRLQHPYASIGNIDTPEIKSQKDIVSCHKTSCLYIYDEGADCIWKVSVRDHQVSRWLDKVKEPNALSVTPNAEFLMLRNSNPVCLEVYNECAILLRRLKLPATIPALSSFHETLHGKYIGLGEQSVFTFRRNGSIVSQFQPSQDSKYRGNPQCFNMSPYHIFLQCCSYYGNNRSSNPHCGTTSSLTLDLACAQILVDKSDGWMRPVTSCYLKETKRILVLEEIVSGSVKTWNLRAYNVLPQ